MSALIEYTPVGLHDFMQHDLEALPRSTAILDVGCGSGAWLTRLQRMGFTDLTGIDIDPPALPGITAARADLNAGEYPLSRAFDLVTSFEVFEHLKNPSAFLRVISKALSPRGRAIITSPNIHSLRYRLKFLLRGKMPSFDEKGEPSHITMLYLPKVIALAAAEGLSVERAWTYPERGSVMFGRKMRALSAIARLALPDPLPGDSICVAFRRVASGVTGP